MTDKRIAIVGAGPGISLAVAKRFAREGYQVVLLARRAEALAGYVSELTSLGVKALGYAADAGQPASLISAFDRLKAEGGNPDVLVYNATGFRMGTPSKLSAVQLTADLAVSIIGALVAAQQVIPAMQSQRRGTILLTGGGQALFPNAQVATVAIGKAGMRNLALTLYQELEPLGIHVATVTVAGDVQRNTFFDPDRIADVYWKLHTQEAEQWEREVIYKPN